jgi:hypothetical protein
LQDALRVNSFYTEKNTPQINIYSKNRLKDLERKGQSYINSNLKMTQISQFENLGEFPFEWENGLDCVGVNTESIFSEPIDWSYDGKCLIAMRHEAFIMDPFNPADHQGITVCQRGFKVTSVKWIYSTSYIIKDPGHEPVFAASSTDPEQQISIWTGKK